jgi:RNA polymerase sigma-70 factor, ECF subfamily
MSWTSPQEALWVLRAQCDDREALELLLRSVQASLTRYLSGFVGAADADDVLQDVLIVICRKLSRLDAPELFRPWAFRIASREAVRHLRRRRRWREDNLEASHIADLAADPEPPAADIVTRLATIEGLSPASRAVLCLHFQEEMTLTDVAAVLELPVGTVKSRLAYGLAALRKQVGRLT